MMSYKKVITDWATEHRIMIAALSVTGSFAGLVFSLLDLQTSIQEKKLRDELSGNGSSNT